MFHGSVVFVPTTTLVGVGGAAIGGRSHVGRTGVPGDGLATLGPVPLPPVAVLANAAEDQDLSLFLGEDLIVWLVLAFGGALLAGNVAAIARPPQRGARKDGDLESAPVARSVVMALIGLVATIWALVSLLA